MDVPVKKLVRLLKADQPAEVRAAAAIILGELAVKDAEASAEMIERLMDEEQPVREAAIKAVGQLKVEKALPLLIERVTQGGSEAVLAAEAAARVGAKGIKALQELMHKVPPGLRRYIAAALTSSGSPGAEAIGVALLLDKDPQLAAATAAAIIANIPKLAVDKKSMLAEELVFAATNKKAPIPHAAELPFVRVMAALNDAKAAAVLWNWVLPPHAPEVRAGALQTVGGWFETPSKDHWKKLFQCAADTDFRVAAPALMILQRLPATEKTAADWLPLFHAPDLAARRLVMDKVGDKDIAAVATGLMEQFHHPDRGVREAARDRLQKLKHGQKELVTALAAAATADDAWQLARTIVGFKDELAAADKTALLDEAGKYIAAHDHRADAFLFLLREADPAGLQDSLLDKAVALRKKKKYADALAYLKLLARDPAIGFAVRLELALCGAKASSHELDPHARENDPCLRNFDTLLQQDAGLLMKELAKAKFLDSADLFYIGFHFSEQLGRHRQFGIDLLTSVSKADPKSEAGKSAKNKLKSVGA